MSNRYAPRGARPAFLIAAFTLLVSSHAIGQERPSIQTRLEQPALAIPATSESDFRMLVGDQSAGN